jgi:hypothetical protein
VRRFSFDIALAVAQDLAMARNLTSLLFADSLWRVVWKESDGKQYVIVDDDGTREYGLWYLPHPDDEEPQPDIIADAPF